ncbi:YicC/YloC family endoribonuclease [Chengkuizengella axinellae]|uniref:YicC/YloC family endoribonuclease n=1 Tax=Chengkuizengella axinellae TaxID=3064388 RepID=A0ABT9IVR0_9BACL|nr:YicC/YloC family endoribonuclease [Chengkuizengella sp. 2205SS18-9]MDP5273358.1 YicC/YloC family endoribonuclease [Chengkuizengella sp. 2205SS18-9]
MFQSMTGFGQAIRLFEGYQIQIDVKSVNHRYREIIVRMPREWLSLEESLKAMIQKRIQRGRVEVFMTIEHQESNADHQLEIDWSLADRYVQAVNQLKDRYQLQDSLSIKDFLAIPELITSTRNLPDQNDFVNQQISECLEDALNQLLEMRKREGSYLREDVMKRVTVMRQHHLQIQSMTSTAVEQMREKLHQRIQEILTQKQLDETRLTMEVALLAERANIDEELTRLLSHFDQCNTLFEQNEPVGRKFDFLIQEMNREVNTIGSKSNFTEITNKVVEMKAELEKIREQVQNIQ